jgi:exopolysaccharide biosynthesis predicted pyruvyltransferase EpsI
LAPYNVGDDRCSRCKRRGSNKCYHIEVCDSTRTDILLRDLEKFLGQYYARYKKDFHLVKSETKLLTDPLHANCAKDIHHIDYVIPDNNLQKKREYTQFIAKECMLRKINIQGANVEEWREMLRECNKLEKNFSFFLQYGSGIRKVWIKYHLLN